VRRLLPIVLIAFLAGCAGGDDGGEDRDGPDPGGSADARLVRGWIAALNASDYPAAASFFAPDALVQQTRTFRLRDRRAAEAFNRSLPCRSTVTSVRNEGETSVASFRLRPRMGAPASACDAVVRVRFRSRGGKFTEWRQLPGEAPGVEEAVPA